MDVCVCASCCQIILLTIILYYNKILMDRKQNKNAQMKAEFSYSMPPFHWYCSPMTYSNFDHTSGEHSTNTNSARLNHKHRESLGTTETELSNRASHDFAIETKMPIHHESVITSKNPTSNDSFLFNNTLNHQTSINTSLFRKIETKPRSREPIKTTCTLEVIGSKSPGRSHIKTEAAIDGIGAQTTHDKAQPEVSKGAQHGIHARSLEDDNSYDHDTTERSPATGRRPLVSVSGLLDNRIPPIAPTCYRSPDSTYATTNDRKLFTDRASSSLNSSGNTDENIDTSNTSSNNEASLTCSSFSPPSTRVHVSRMYKCQPIVEDMSSMPHKPTCSEMRECNTDKKKARTSYTLAQVRRLKTVLANTLYPDVDTLECLSREFGIPQKRIKVWFQNKRARRKCQLPHSMRPTQPVVPFYSMPSVGTYASPYGFVHTASLAPFYRQFLGSVSAPIIPTGYPFHMLSHISQQMSNH